jgi:uncharacterized membrane protein YfcA
MEHNIIFFIVVGFIAQTIDGAMGMAYGVSANTILLSIGVTPAAASASLHFAEIFTTAVSGISHIKLGNVSKSLIKKLLIPGIIGGVLGAYLLSSIDGNTIKPFVSTYLLVVGLVILVRAFRTYEEKRVTTKLFPLGLIGGFFDAVGGGGWGPIVTSTLIARGNHPRYSIGSVNTAEFFVTLFESFTFFITIGFIHWKIIEGLIIGGVLAAPMAAYLCKKIHPRILMFLVGLLITGLSIRTIILVLK